MSTLVSGNKRPRGDPDAPDRNAARVFESGAQTVPVSVGKDKIVAACSRIQPKGWLTKLSLAAHAVREAVLVFTKRNVVTMGLAEVYQVINGFEAEAGEAYKEDKFMINTIWKNTYRPMGIPVENAPLEGGAGEPLVTVGVAGIVTTRVVTASPGGRAVADFPLVAATSTTPSADSTFDQGRVTLVIREADEDMMAYRVLRAHAIILQNPQIWLQAQNDYYSPHPTFNAARQQQTTWAAAGLAAIDYVLRKGLFQVRGAKGPVPNLDDPLLDNIVPEELLGGNADANGLQDSLESHEIVARIADLTGLTAPIDSIAHMVASENSGRYRLYQYALAQQMLYGAQMPYVNLETARDEMPDMAAYEGENSYYEFGRKLAVGGGLEFAGRYVDSNVVSNNRTGSFLKVLMNAARRSLSSYSHAVEEDWIWTIGTFMTGSNPDASGNAIIAMTR